MRTLQPGLPLPLSVLSHQQHNLGLGPQLSLQRPFHRRFLGQFQHTTLDGHMLCRPSRSMHQLLCLFPLHLSQCTTKRHLFPLSTNNA